MTVHHKKLVEEIFLTAADLPAGERDAYLATACADAEIAREVRSLLNYDTAGATTFDNVVAHAAASLVAVDPLIGTRLGPYRITEELGKGGMGAVFLAIRDDQTFEKKVAVKVVKRGMDSVAVLDRFRHERRILANLDHPYIGRLIDAGSTPDGRPYFVMEYVEGQPIVAYCSEHKLDLNSILELFRKVCNAVSCAHRNLIVHRDLKATNILVSADGSPKLLDFGIAKLLDPQNRTEDTAPHSRMLTLDCASPEQIRGEPVTTSTDIYSLGILLFELLAGRPPWNLSSMPITEAHQIICYTPAPKPSFVLRESGEDTGDSRSWRALTGDLDNIVLMALRKDSDRRYRSVDEFSEDIRYFQTGHPVVAREDSFGYRATKFLRRHGVPVTLASIAIIGLLVGIVYANIQRRRAEVRLNQMLSMANQTLLDLHAQIERQPGSTETRMRITKSTVDYLANLASEAGNNQEVRSTLGKAYLGTGDLQGYPDAPNLGDTAGALASYQAAEKLLGPEDHVPRARLFWHRGVVLFKTGNVPAGLPWLRKAVAEVEHLDTRDALYVQAFTLHSLAYALTPSDPEQALALSRRETEIFTKLTLRDPNDAEVQQGLADSYNATGGALLRRNRMEEALAWFKKGAAVMEPLSARHPTDVFMRRDLMNANLRIGDVLGNPARRNLGDRRGALPYYRKAQAIAESLAAADSSNRLAQMDLLEVVWRTGVVMDSPEDAKASLAALDSAREMALRIANGKELNTTLARIVSTIDEFRGWRFESLQKMPEAVSAFQRSHDVALAIFTRDKTDSSAVILMLRDKSGICPAMAAMGRREESLACAQAVIALARQVEANGPDRVSMAPYIPRAWMWLGAVYEELAKRDPAPQRKQDWAEAGKNYTEASEAWQKLHGRADITRFQADIDESAKKAAECNRRAVSRV